MFTFQKVVLLGTTVLSVFLLLLEVLLLVLVLVGTTPGALGLVLLVVLLVLLGVVRVKF